jgi:bifunctional non-homologous end joining protein LigD
MAKKEIGNYSFEVEKLDKIFFPGDGITKGDVMDYYEKVSGYILLHLKDRPITMQRFPEGIDESGFYQKEVPDYFPDWIDRIEVEVESEEEGQKQVIVNKKATLIYLVEQACITFHVWTSRMDKLNYPDKLVFDLDPPDGGFEQVRSAAFSLRELMKDMDVRCHVMTTGSRGVHVIVALERDSNFDAVRKCGEEVTSKLMEEYPDTFTSEVRKSERSGKIYLDNMRNAYGQTSVVPYSVRPILGAPIATPIEWEELKDEELVSQTYRLENIMYRLGQKGDPWESLYDEGYSIPDLEDRLDSL